jgi:hypothetical protein
MRRRDFLKKLAAVALGASLPACDNKFMNLFGSGEEKLWGLNVHPYGGSLDTLQLQALAELKIRKIRITLGLGRDLAGVYLGSYPAEYVGLISDFDLSRVSPASWPGMVRDVVDRSAGVSFYEILNEPELFMGLSPEVYVKSYLRPAYEIIRERRPSVPVIAAAPVGTAGGRTYFYQMTDAGADDYCDFRAAHLYDDNPEVFLAGTDRPFMVTETGKSIRERHLSWWQDTMSHISKVLDTERLYFYVLLDRPDTGFSLIASSPDAAGNVRPVSPLYTYIKDL